jgi:hypothetical protein
VRPVARDIIQYGECKMTKPELMVSEKAKKAVLRMIEREKARRPPDVVRESARRAEVALRRLAKSRTEAQRLNHHNIAQVASV